MALGDIDKYEIVQNLSSGKTPYETSQLTGHSRETILKVKQERREQIERETAKYLDSLPKAVEQQKQLIEQYDQINSQEDPARFNASVKAWENMLKAVGILPTNTTSIAIQNIYNDHRSSDGVSEMVIAALGRFLDDKMGLGEPVEAEFTQELSTAPLKEAISNDSK